MIWIQAHKDFVKIFISLFSRSLTINAQSSIQKHEPFEGIEQALQNGSDRCDSSVFSTLDIGKYKTTPSPTIILHQGLSGLKLCTRNPVFHICR
jgi:hypothetical protein